MQILNFYSKQAAILCGAEHTYVQLLYPENGLNWLQGDIGNSGLPDVRAQAGFVSDDGRAHGLPGTGTDSVSFICLLIFVVVVGMNMNNEHSMSICMYIVPGEIPQ